MGGRQKKASHLPTTDKQQQRRLLANGVGGGSGCLRFDNVANCSELLRSFGELSSELLDLGCCILLSVGQVGRSSARRTLLELSPDLAIFGPSTASFGQAISERIQQQDQADQPSGRYEDKFTSLNANDRRNQLEEPSVAQTQLEAHIQDLRSLFQVNRLIIDRSILLLLAASKCCLREGDEFLRGFEARCSVIGQIRASISIILATIKCAVFCQQLELDESRADGLQVARSARLRLQPNNLEEAAHRWSTKAANQSARLSCSQANFAFEDDDQSEDIEQDFDFCAQDERSWYWPHLEQAEWLFSSERAKSFPLASCGVIGGDKLSSSAAIEQMQQQLQRRTGLDQNEQLEAAKIQLRVAGSGAGSRSEAGSKLANQATGQLKLERVHNYDSAGSSLPIGSFGKLSQNATPCSNSTNSSSIAGAHLTRAIRIGAKWPLKIMNYFLLTWNGAQSAHDAISRLQLLVQNLRHVSDEQTLISNLNEVFEIQRLFEHQDRDLEGSSTLRSEPLFEECRVTSGALLAELEARDRQVDQLDPENKRKNININMNNNGNNLNNNKENEHVEAKSLNSVRSDTNTTPTTASSNTQAMTLLQEPLNCLLMNKRQLISALSESFLGDVRSNLVERVHEFTDCAYTKHDQRESIVNSVQCIKLILNRLVKLVYRMRRRPSNLSQLNLAQLRHLARQLDEFCAELKYELQSVVIEQADELDRCNSEWELLGQLKHQCLLGDVAKVEATCLRFHETSERLVELCKMLNQVLSSNRMKIYTKTLALWFERNSNQLVASGQTFARFPRSQSLKDCLWAQIQVWCSFYDDFAHLVRQLAYLSHTSFDQNRANRVAAFREHVILKQQFRRHQPTAEVVSQDELEELLGQSNDVHSFLQADQAFNQSQNFDERLLQASSVSSLDGRISSSAIRGQIEGQVGTVRQTSCSNSLEAQIDSPRSLDHYYGFGVNYHRSRQQLEQHQQRQMRPQTQRDFYFRRSHFLPQLDLHEPSERFESEYMIQRQQEQQPAIPVKSTRFEADQSRQPRHRSDVGGDLLELDACASLQLEQPAHLHLNQQQVTIAPAPAAASFQAGNNELQQQQQQQHLHRDQHKQQQRARSSSARRSRSARRPINQFASDSIELNSMSSDSRDEQLAPRHNPPGATPNIRGEQQPVSAGAEISKSSSTSGPVGSHLEPEPARSGVPSELQLPGEPDKLEQDCEADAIIRGAQETAQMAMSMYQFTRGEGDLNTTQDLFTQAELFAEEANEFYKEVRCFSYKVPAGNLKRDLLSQLGLIPALVQQLQFVVKGSTVGKAATFAKVDSIIRETRALMEAVNRVVNATLACRQHYNMAIASMRKRSRMLSPTYRGDTRGFEFDSHLSGSGRQASGLHGGGRHAASGAGSMGSEPDIWHYGRGPSSRRAVARNSAAASKTRVSFLLF